MKILYLSRTDIKEHLRIHIVNSGGERMIDRLIKEERYQVCRIDCLIIVNNAVSG